MQAPYNTDLAYIHDAEFGHLASHAAPVVKDALKQSQIDSGTVVELGCGSGISSRSFCDAGFEVLGFDISEPLIRIARKRVPEAEFRIESFTTAPIPPCVAVTAVGEIFNYTFDDTNNDSTRLDLWQRIYQALLPGGIFLFDMAGPDRIPATSPHKTFFETPDWAVLVQTEANNPKSLLTRHITTFRKREELYRRDSETHRLQLVEPDRIVSLLEDIGFSVQTFNSYGPQLLPPGLTAFLAAKTADESSQNFSEA